MKRLFAGVLSFTAIFCAMQAIAARVTEQQASIAAKAWVKAGAKLGARIGSVVEKTSTVKTKDGHSFYAVKFAGGGTVFTSADTESEPIVAFTSSGDDFSKMSTNSPLYKLLARDALVRANIRARSAGSAGTSGLSPLTSSISGKRSGNLRRWSRLLSRQATAKTAASGTVEDILAIDDVRVAPLLQSKWSQEDVNGENCYNYYTPQVLAPDGTLVHAPCGCTATALAQTMRYFKFPQEEVESQEDILCNVDGMDMRLNTIAGVYNWDAMTLVPEDGCTEINREAIGHLTYDVSVLLESEYTYSGTGAYLYSIPSALTKMGYKSARCLWTYSQLADETEGKQDGRPKSPIGLHNAATRRNLVYTNLDSARPVIFAIYGYDSQFLGDAENWQGHAVVGDGYGMVNYIDQTTGEAGEIVEYVHINMGWAGSDDAWYNIPEIVTDDTDPSGEATEFHYTVMAGAVYNIHTNDTGEIVSGRVFDENGNPLSGVVISTADGEYVGSSNEKGIYSLVLPSRATYKLNARSLDARYVGSVSVNVGKSSSSWGGSDSSDVGNRWGADIDLKLSEYADSVRLKSTGTLYSDLMIAVEEAAEGETIEILKPTGLSGSWSFDKSVTLVSTNDNAAASPIYVGKDVIIDVSAGRLNLTNVVFAGAPYLVHTNMTSELGNFNYATNLTMHLEMAPFAVSNGASIAVAGTVQLPEVKLAGPDCFELAGAITRPIALTTESMERGEIVGFATCSEETAAECSKYLVNSADPYLAAMVREYPRLRWDLAEVSDEDLVGTLELAGSTEVFRYSNLDRLFADVTNSATITVLKSVPITRRLDIENISVTITGSAIGGYGVVNEIGPEAGFKVGSGASLEVSNLMFSGYTGNGLFIVDGEGANLEFSRNVIIVGVNGTNYHSGAVSVFKGTAKIGGSCSIIGCKALGGGQRAGNGGAVYLEGEGATLDLLAEIGTGAVTIDGCSASGFGGGIYAGRGSVVNLSGIVRVLNCQAEASGRKVGDNIFLDCNSSARATLNVKGALYDDFRASAIGLRYYMKSGTFGNAAGLAFALNECAGDVASNNTRSFSCDANPELLAEVAEDQSALLWSERTVEASRTTRDPGDVVRLIRADGSTTNYYVSVSEAMADFGEGPEVMEVLEGCYLDTVLTVSGKLVVRSDHEASEKLTLYRGSRDNRIIVAPGGSLTFENINVSGKNGAYNIFGTREFIEVDGGSLTLGRDARLSDVSSSSAGNRASGGITVYNSGSVTMLPGSAVANCRNLFVNESNAASVGAGILIDNGFGYFRGGTVSGCRAYRAGGVFAGNNSVVEISGDFSVTGNFALDDSASDMVVESDSSLILKDKLDGSVAINGGIHTDEYIFGMLSPDFAGENESITNSAAKFISNDTGAFGVIAVNADSGVTNLVWSTAFDDEGVYVDKNGAEYVAVLGIPEVEEVAEWADPLPIRFTFIGCSDGVWTLRFANAVKWCNYSLYATNSLVGGFVIDGAEPVTNFQWKSDETEVSLQLKAAGETMFWKALGERGEIEKE